MKLYNTFDMVEKGSRTITIGNFDGLHLGHQKLIEKNIEVAKRNQQKSTVLTFSFHTNKAFNKEVKYICGAEKKKELLENTGIDELFIVEFNEELRKKTTQEFIEEILIEKMQAGNLVLGDDAKIGSDMIDIQGIQNICNKVHLDFHVLPQVEIEGKRVTSSLIRSMIQEGKVGKQLERFLGREYSLQGKVIHGNSFGSKIGYPTANIEIQPQMLIPKYGVYYGVCKIGEASYDAGINIGIKPSVENNYFSVEAFLLDFNAQIYGKEMTIYLKNYMREEKKFNSIEALTQQMDKDIDKIRKYSKQSKPVK